MANSYSAKRTEIVFDIDGEEFQAKKIPGGLFVDFTRQSATATDEQMADMLYDAFASAMDEATFERFWKHCVTDLDLETMIEIFQDLTRASAGRPTKPSSPSAPGRRRARAAAGSSAVASISKASTSENSAT